MKRRLFKEDRKHWCEVTIEVAKGRLSICGDEGSVVPERHGRKMALNYWTSFFEDSPSERHAMNDRFNRSFKTAVGAAKFVLDQDGDFHGLAVHVQKDGKLYLTESWGQIRETIERWFPDVAPYFKWHLNDMHAECEHQEARGETWESHPNAVCGDCDYKLGSAWLKRELPAEVLQWASTVGEAAADD